MNIKKIILGLLLLALSWIPGAASASTFSADEQASLARGEVVRHPLDSNANREGYLGGTSYTVVDAPPDVVYRAMGDFASFPNIFPRTMGADIISDRGDRKVVKMTQGTSFLAVSFYVLNRLDEAARKVSWELVQDQPHDLDDTRGYWQVDAYGEGKSLLTYVNVINIGHGGVLSLIAGAIQNGLLGAPGNLRDWVEGPSGVRYRDDGIAIASAQ
jgi:ribosome-associated toxin RatA of RatAB toxin-antitoxin module